MALYSIIGCLDQQRHAALGTSAADLGPRPHNMLPYSPNMLTSASADPGVRHPTATSTRIQITQFARRWLSRAVAVMRRSGCR
jgi:hypothetical protein